MLQLLAQQHIAQVNFRDFNKSIWPDATVQPTPSSIFNDAMPYLFSIAGLILFVMLVWGAFEIMMGAGDPKNAESGKKRITAAVTGFILLFLSYWIGQVIQYIFGLNFGLM